MKLDTPNPSLPASGNSHPIGDAPVGASSFDEFANSTPEDWKAAAELFLKGAPFEKKLVTRTPEGVALQPIYFAGHAPATIRPPHFGRLIAQEVAGTDPVSFNRALLADLMAGQNSAPLVLDFASRLAMDPAETAAGEADHGIRIASLQDLRTALDGVDLAAAPLFIWAGASALPMLGLVGAIAEERGCRTTGWAGAVLGDPLTEWAREGSLSLDLADAYDEMASTLRWSESRMPRLRVIGIRASLWADAGGSAVDELAFALATGTEYLREMVRSGIDADAAAQRMLFEFSLGSQVFMQIAKLRAARPLWAKIVEAFGGDGSVPMAVHGRCTAFNKSSLDPHTNLLRATGEAFAGIVGGVEGMHVAPFDECARTPEAFSRRLARNIPIILDEECGLADVADPAGGSWFVETLTRDIANAAWKRFQEIEAAGGMAAALRTDAPQKTVSERADERLAAMATGREVLIGVNFSANPAEAPLADRSRTRREEDAPAGSSKPDLSGDSASRVTTRISDVPSAIEAFLSEWTIGRVRKALPRNRAIEPAIQRVQVRNASGGFEALRAGARAFSAANGGPPAAWLATFGPPRQHRARADFSSGFLACGGFDVRSGLSAASIDDAIRDAVAANVPVVVICSTDDTYPEIVPAFAQALKREKPATRLLVAGAPGDHEAEWRAAGVDEFIHLRVNRLAVLENLLSTLIQPAE